MNYFFFFFFSSRRRHTRFDCDWSSDVCSSDLGRELDRGSALDGLTFSAASLAGPALAAGVAAGIGARAAVLTAAGLVVLAVPPACSLSRYRPAAANGPGQSRRAQDRITLRRQMAAGFALIVARRPLLRATVTSVVSYAGIGMLLVCCPLLGAQRLGGPARGALLISAIAVASLTANAILRSEERRVGKECRSRWS